MQDHTDIEVTDEEALPATVAPSWAEEVADLMRRAAELAEEHGISPEQFMAGAWAAVLDASPGLREHMEDVALMERVDHMRKRGLVGNA